MSIEFSVALSNLKQLVSEFSPLGELSNEAQTRFSFIDKLLQDCLGWSNTEIKVENHESGDRTDYECGKPRSLIVEAKRSSIPFDFPPRSSRNPTRIRLDSLISFSDQVGDAIKQAQSYCISRGVDLAAVSNGPQLIVFLATRTDSQSPLSADACVFDGYEDLVKNFIQVFELISADGVSETRYKSILQERISLSLPSKLSSLCIDYYAYNYSSDFQESLRNAASLIIEDLGRSSDVEKEFLEQCYCESGPLSQYSLLGKNILSARYAALFPSGETASRIEPVNPKKGNKEQFTEKVVAEAMARRPLILLGDVGVGKTSFLKHLIKISATEVFKNTISIYFDLGSSAALSTSTKDALLSQIESTMRKDLKVNKFDSKLNESIYSVELEEFDNGVMSALREVDSASFLKSRLEFLNTLIAKREIHLRLILSHIAKQKACQTVIVIDNADQRSPDIQNEAFVIAQELCASWDAIVFVALRPQTFHGSKRSGAVSAYPSKVFVIPPPKLEDAIDKRLVFAQRIAEGRLPLQSISGVSLHLESLTILIQALRRSFVKNPELMEFLVNVTSGNIRLAVELVARFFGNPNVQSEKIVRISGEGGDYVVPIHEFAKTALLGDYSHFQESSSVASNVFNVVFPDPKEHFLSLYILGYLSWDSATGNNADGFVTRVAIIDEMQSIGYTKQQIQEHLVRLTRKKLIETSERRTLEDTSDTKVDGLPEMFRVTSLGVYIQRKWAGDFSYLEAMAFDTPIFDSVIRNELAKDVNDDALFKRYIRATSFRDYLNSNWNSVEARAYFDWDAVLSAASTSFSRVERRLGDLGYLG